MRNRSKLMLSYRNYFNCIKIAHSLIWHIFLTVQYYHAQHRLWTGFFKQKNRLVWIVEAGMHKSLCINRWERRHLRRICKRLLIFLILGATLCPWRKRFTTGRSTNRQSMKEAWICRRYKFWTGKSLNYEY